VGGEALYLVSCSGTETAPRDVQGAGGHPEAKRVDHAHPTREADAGGRKHRVASAALVERGEHWWDKLDVRPARATIDQHGGPRAARDENAARAVCMQPARARDNVRRGAAGRIVLPNELFLAEPQQLHAASSVARSGGPVKSAITIFLFARRSLTSRR
jgi:hypothetical protein